MGGEVEVLLWGLMANTSRWGGNLGGDEEVLEVDCGDGRTTLDLLKTNGIHLWFVNYTSIKLQNCFKLIYVKNTCND